MNKCVRKPTPPEVTIDSQRYLALNTKTLQALVHIVTVNR